MQTSVGGEALELKEDTEDVVVEAVTGAVAMVVKWEEGKYLLFHTYLWDVDFRNVSHLEMDGKGRWHEPCVAVLHACMFS